MPECSVSHTIIKYFQYIFSINQYFVFFLNCALQFCCRHPLYYFNIQWNPFNALKPTYLRFFMGYWYFSLYIDFFRTKTFYQYLVVDLSNRLSSGFVLCDLEPPTISILYVWSRIRGRCGLCFCLFNFRITSKLYSIFYFYVFYQFCFPRSSSTYTMWI